MDPLLRVINLKKHYHNKTGFFSTSKEVLKAVDDVSFHINPCETLGIVGESGCGKTTTGKSIIRLIEPTDGTVIFDNVDVTKLPKEEMRLFRNKMQIVFQDAMSCLDPRWRIGKSLREPIKNFNSSISRNEAEDRIDYLLNLVGLPIEAKIKYPHEFSGGQRQRIGIAKAMSLNPKFVVCDESVSALDVSIQAQILNLFIKLKNEFNLSYMFISHDLSVVKYISDRVAVMYAGKIVEISRSDDFFKDPVHPYSKLLISSVPTTDLSASTSKIEKLGIDINDAKAESGCRFYSRCPNAMQQCSEEQPDLKEISDGHLVSCFNY